MPDSTTRIMGIKKAVSIGNTASPLETSTDGAATTLGDEAEIFGTSANGVHGAVDFRTVSWLKAAIFLLKMTFATGVLSIPASLYTLGAVAGAICILFWGLLNTYMAYVQGQFKLAHPSVHTVADAAHIAVLDLGHSKRTAYVVREITATVASVRKIQHLAWVTWLGFMMPVTAILLIVIAVTIPDRPAAAPKTGDFDLRFSALPPSETDFVSAWAASLAIFASSANTSGFVSVNSEIRKPNDFFKSLYTCMTWVTSSYLALGLTVYAYCGKWVTLPAMGSAGPNIKIIAYAIAVLGLIASAMICVHIAAKSVFVRLLRGTRHLTENNKTHWAVWLTYTYGTGAAGYILSEAVPFFSSLCSLIGALDFGPLGICVPILLWTSSYKGTWQRSMLWKCAWIILLGVFALGLSITIGGTYANVVNIVAQYDAGEVDSAFSYADDSGTVVSS